MPGCAMLRLNGTTTSTGLTTSLIVLVVSEQLATEVGGDHFRGQEVVGSERRLAGPRRADEGDNAELWNGDCPLTSAWSRIMVGGVRQLVLIVLGFAVLGPCGQSSSATSGRVATDSYAWHNRDHDDRFVAEREGPILRIR
jgi:hypothetical protein